MGLSNRAQAIFMIISAILVAASGVSVPVGGPWWVALILGLLGAAGMGIKEALGDKKT
jgi:uncharacterized membrane protein YjjP (DUF1212 family)